MPLQLDRNRSNRRLSRIVELDLSSDNIETLSELNGYDDDNDGYAIIWI